jgi:hypothetical protein
MQNIFETLIIKLLEVGFFDFLLFAIGLAMFYAILKRVKLFDSQIVNSLLAFSVAFFIFGYPVLMNFSLVLPFVTFFTQAFLFMTVFMVGMLLASFFYPDLPKFLSENFTSRSTLWSMVAVGVAIAVISGTAAIMYTTIPADQATRPLVPGETSTVAAGVIVFVLLLIIAGSIAMRQA